MKILVTGGLGYIGSHTVVELLNSGHDVIIIDDLSNSQKSVLDKIKTITGKEVVFYEGNVADIKLLNNIFQSHSVIDLVIHFAGLKAVAESIKNPLEYYSHNLGITFILLDVMQKYNCRKIIFSSSATVYGSEKPPVHEGMQTGLNITNPYGKTKYFIEELLKDLSTSDPKWSIIILRYFNPVGAHQSHLIGENPNNIPNNLMPYILKVSSGTYPILNIYGSDYNTMDCTCVRDFVHVMDLATGHLAAIRMVDVPGVHIYNLGTGIGSSVKQIVETFERVNHITLPHTYVERRAGDLAEIYADVTKAKNELGWEAIYNLDQMCVDSYEYQKKLSQES